MITPGFHCQIVTHLMKKGFCAQVILFFEPRRKSLHRITYINAGQENNGRMPVKLMIDENWVAKISTGTKQRYIQYQKGHSQPVFILREYSSYHGEKRNVNTRSKQTFREVGNLHILHEKTHSKFTNFSALKPFTVLVKKINCIG